MENKYLLKYILSNLEKAKYELNTTNKLLPNTINDSIIIEIENIIKKIQKEIENGK